MPETQTLSRTYPWTTSIEGLDVTFRLMVASDRDAILAFAQDLPPHDLLYLRTDVTKKEVVEDWIRNVEAGRTITVMAEIDGKLAGYSSIHRNEVRWNRHVGELRVMVAKDRRGLGLGRRLTNEGFGITKDLGLKKVTGHMTTDQRSARQVFEHLGFRPEALLADYVSDRDGTTHDLLIMSYDVEGFTNVADTTIR
jgi:RimJ/RimL family protein N-acetyltransferase